MWKGVEWDGEVIYSDIDPSVNPDVVADFTSLPFDPESFDAIIFDPPHLPKAAASEKSGQGSAESMTRMYGLPLSTKGHIAEWFSPFLGEAHRVLRSEGIILAKIKDYIHSSTYQWTLVDWVNAVRAQEGLTPCEVRIKIDPCAGNLSSGRWKKVHHARVVHTWWTVTRKGRCVRRTYPPPPEQVCGL